MGPHPMHARAKQKTMFDGLLSGTRSTNRRINVTPVTKRITNLDSPQGDQPRKIVLEIFTEIISDKRPMALNRKIDRNKTGPLNRKRRGGGGERLLTTRK